MVTVELSIEEDLCNEGCHADTKINMGIQRNEIKMAVFDFISKLFKAQGTRLKVQARNKVQGTSKSQGEKFLCSFAAYSKIAVAVKSNYSIVGQHFSIFTKLYENIFLCQQHFIAVSTNL